MKTYSRKNSSYLKKAFVASNFNEMCRLCLSEVDMVLTPIIQDYKISYQEWIHYSVDVLIEEGDGLPPNICEECLAMVEQSYLFKKKCKASDSKLREHLELIELNEEEKLNGIGFNDSSEDHKNLFTKEHPSENKCDESSAVDSGGTDNEPPTESESNKGPVSDVEFVSDIENQCKKVNDLESVEEESVEKESAEPEPQEKLIINKVQRYILKGEKRADDQEEDLTVCEVVPLDVRNEDSEESESYGSSTLPRLDNSKVQNGHLSVNEPNSEKSDTRIREIYQLWDNEDEGEEGREETENSEERIMILDMVWDDDTDKSTNKQNTQVVEVSVEDSAVQMHRVYTNKNQIQIIETMPDTKRFQCFACDDHFSTSNKLKEHLIKIHKQVSDIAFCEICCKSFTCTNSLRRHMVIHSGFKPYKCKICGREFSQGSILKRHVLTHENVKPFNCHICNKGYTQKMNLLSHLKNHGFQIGTENFRCKMCSKSFVHQSGLSRHLKLHKGVRFLCVHCMRSFGDASALTRHIKAVHPQT